MEITKKEIDTGIDQITKRKIIGTAQAVVPGVKVYLFGSRARGTYHPHSDIDIALYAGDKIPLVTVGEIRDMLNASNIPQRIDVLDIHYVQESLRNEILSKGILWTS